MKKILLLSIIWIVVSCDGEKKLSPVNISNPEKALKIEKIYADYYISDYFVIDNLGKKIKILVVNSALVVPDETNYLGQDLSLKKIEIKSPSEHTVDGDNYPLELQFYHADSTGKIFIASVFVQKGKENPFFQVILDNLPEKGKPARVDIPLDVYYLFPTKQEYWTYNGSYTQKPYNQDVTWYILKYPIEVSNSQINEIINVIGKNKNNVVSLGDRKLIEH